MRTAVLTGTQEVPANTSQGIGRIRVDVSPDTLAVRVALTTSGFTATAAHIHQGLVGVNAGVIVPFTQVTPGNWVSANSNTPMTLAQAIAFAGGGTYANAHSAAYPGGEIRAQLVGTD